MNKITIQSIAQPEPKIQVGNLFINPRSPEDVYVLVRNPTGGFFAANIVSGMFWRDNTFDIDLAVNGLEQMESGTKFTVEVA